MTIVLKSQAAMATCHNWTEDTDVVVYGCMMYVYSTTVAPSPWVQNIHPFQLPGCDVSILISWPTELHWSLITLLHKICNHQIHSTSFAWLTVNKKSTIITDKNSWSSSPASFLVSLLHLLHGFSSLPASCQINMMNYHESCMQPSINDIVRWEV